MNQVDRLIKEIDQEVKKAFEQKPVDPEAVQQWIEKYLNKVLSERKLPPAKFHVKDRGEGEMEMIPENLYSYIVLMGFEIPEGMVGQEIVWKGKYGEYHKKDDKYYFSPDMPIESIQINLTLTKDGMFLDENNANQ